MSLEYFQFRVTEEDDSMLTNIILWVRSETKCLLAVKEIGSATEKKHIHCLIQIKNKSTFIQKFHKKFPARYVGNKSYSCEQLKKALDNSLRYLSKGEKRGDHPVTMFSSYTESEILEFHNQYWDENESLKIPKKDKKGSTLTWSQVCKLDYQKEHPEIVSQLIGTCSLYHPTDSEKEIQTSSKFHLFSYCMKRLGKSVKVLDEGVIKKLYNGIYNSIVQEDEHSSSRFNKDLFNSIILL